MTNKKVLISIGVFILLSIGIYITLGEKHPFIAVLSSFLVLTKLKLIGLISLVWAKAYLFVSASKSKIFIFIKNLTFMKGISLAIKRFILDNVVSKWIERNFTQHISEPIRNWFSYYKSLNYKTKIKKSLTLILPASVITFFMYFGGYLESLALYAQLKILIIGFFKFLWVVLAKLITTIVGFVSGTWLSPIVEILALSWLLSLIEKIPFIGPPISRFFQNIGDNLGLVFSKLSALFYKYIGRHFSNRLSVFGQGFGNYLTNFVNKAKVKNEIAIFNKFKKKYLLKDIQKYFKGNYNRKNKVEFYKNVNEITNDHIDIKAFIELNGSFDNIQDFFILEGLASSNKTGSSDKRISKDSFWIMNLNEMAFVVFSKSDAFKPRFIAQNALKLIQPKKVISYDDIYIVDVNQKKYSVVRDVYDESDIVNFVRYIYKSSTNEFMLI